MALSLEEVEIILIVRAWTHYNRFGHLMSPCIYLSVSVERTPLVFPLSVALLVGVGVSVSLHLVVVTQVKIASPRAPAGHSCRHPCATDVGVWASLLLRSLALLFYL